MTITSEIARFPDHLDLSKTVAPLAAAERMIGRLARALQTSPVAQSWRSRYLREAAAAEAYLAGWSANPDGVHLARIEFTQGSLPIGERWASDVLETLEGALKRSPSSLLTAGAIATLSFPRAGMTWFSPHRALIERLEDDPVDMMPRLESWCQAFSKPPESLLDVLCALRAWHEAQPMGMRQEPIMRLLLPVLLARGQMLPLLALHTAQTEMRRPLPSPEIDENAWFLGMLSMIRRIARGNLVSIDLLHTRYRNDLELALRETTKRSKLPDVWRALFIEEQASIDILRSRLKRWGIEISDRAMRDIMAEMVRLNLATEVTGRYSFRVWRLSAGNAPAKRPQAKISQPRLEAFQSMIDETKGLAPLESDAEGDALSIPSVFDVDDQDEDFEDNIDLD